MKDIKRNIVFNKSCNMFNISLDVNNLKSILNN